MRVLAVTNLYPNPLQPHRAPYNRHQFRILGEKYPIHVVAPVSWIDRYYYGNGSKLPHSCSRDGLSVDHPTYFYPPKFFRNSYGRCYYWSTHKAVARAVNEFKPTVIFAPWAYPDGWAAVQFGARYRLPVVIQVHGSDVLLLKQFPARIPKTVEALHGADGIIAVSHHLSSEMQSYGISCNKIHVIHDGVDKSLFFPGDKLLARKRLGLNAKGLYCLFVGNLVHVKAVDRLLRAFAVVQSVCDDATLFLIGDGPLRKSLGELSQRLKIARSVKFIGQVVQTELPLWYQASDLFVLPSLSEGVPNVLLEASACNLPWIASNVGGIPEITNLGRCRLVSSDDDNQLAQAITDMLKTGASVEVDQVMKDRQQAVDELASILKHYES